MTTVDDVLPASPSKAERKAAPGLAAAVRDLDSRRARSRQRKIGASEIGECRRRAGYRIARTKPTNASTGLQAALGTMIHKGALAALKRMYGGWTEVRVDSEQVKGSIDYLRPSGITAGGVLYACTVDDLKTTSKGSFEKVQTRGAYAKHWYQVTTYSWLLRTGHLVDRRLVRDGYEPGTAIDVDQMLLRYVCRDNGEELLIERDYDPAFAAEAILWLTDVYAMVEEHGVDYVPRDGFGPGIDSMCDYCPFLDECWGPPVEAEQSRQSQLTVTDEDLIEAVSDYDKWRSVESEAKRHKEFARERCRGKSGVAGDLVLAWTGGNSRPQVDKDAALQSLVERGEVLPTRMVTSSVSIKVTKNHAKADAKADKG